MGRAIAQTAVTCETHCTVETNGHHSASPSSSPSSSPTAAKPALTWVPVANKGSFSDEDDVSNAAAFNAIWALSPNQILRRKCPGCVDSHKDIYYRRFDNNGLPAGFELLDLVKNNWFSDSKISGNTFNDDFKLYSTYSDALADMSAWIFCNFNDPGVGFPRDCGPNGSVPFQWNSFEARRGGKRDIGFYVETM